MANRIITYWNSGSMTFDPPLETFAEFVATDYPSRATLESAASGGGLLSGYYSISSNTPDPILTYWDSGSMTFDPPLTLWDNVSITEYTTLTDLEASGSSGSLSIGYYEVPNVTWGSSNLLNAKINYYNTVTELLDAADVGIDSGYYEVPGLILTKYDGFNFSERLSRIQDILSDVAIWLDPSGHVYQDETSVYAWKSKYPPVSGAVGFNAWTTATLGSIDAIDVSTGTWTMQSSDFYVDGPFEVFATIKLDNTTDTNKGVAGTWDGSAGFILGCQDFVSPNSAFFGFDGTWARGSSRLDTDPHVVHGRYTGTELVISVDDVDLNSVSKTGTSTSVAPLYVGSYDNNSITKMNGLIGHFLLVKRELTTTERSKIVSELLSEIQ